MHPVPRFSCPVLCISNCQVHLTPAHSHCRLCPLRGAKTSRYSTAALAGLRLSESIAEQHADDSDSESGIDAHQLPERFAIYSVLGHYGIASGIHGLGGIKLGVHDLGESLDLAQDIVPRQGTDFFQSLIGHFRICLGR